MTVHSGWPLSQGSGFEAASPSLAGSSNTASSLSLGERVGVSGFNATGALLRHRSP
jgi:hypothetical protein